MLTATTLTTAQDEGTFADAVLTIGQESYSLTKAPLGTYSLVKAQKEILTADLNIADMMDNLSLSVKLIYLAQCGVAGTGQLAANVGKRQMQLLRLMTECSATIGVIRDNTLSIVEDLIEAFKILSDVRYPNEEQAIKIFTECSEYAHEMAGSCSDLADKVQVLVNDIGTDAQQTEVQIGTQNAEVRALKKLQQELNENLAQQKVLADKLKSSIEGLQQEITEAKQDEQTESTRAFAMGIVSAITGAIGSALGAYASAASRGAIKPGQAEEDPAVKETTEKVAQEKKNLKKLEEEEAELKEQKEEIEEKVKKQEEVIESSKATIAEKTEEKNKKTGAEKAALEEEIEKAEAARVKAKKQQEEATAALTALEKKMEEQNRKVAAAGAALRSMQASLEKQTDVANKRAESARSLRLTLMQQKRDDEKAQREALGLVASLTEKLKAAGENQQVAESSLAALQIAKWALSNVFVSLSQFEDFWRSMATYCEGLAQNKLLKSISRKASWTREARAAWFKEEDFARGGIGYLVNWQALNTVALEYLSEAQRIKKSVEANIKKAPTIAEAKEQLPLLEKEIKEELTRREASSQARTLVLVEAEQQLSA